MSRSILFTFNPPDKGGTKSEAIGFHGKGCVSTLKSFVRGMKSSKISGEPSLEPEYHEKESQGEEAFDG